MFNIFKQFPNLVVGVSTKADGPMGLSYQVEKDENIKQRRKEFLKKSNVGIEQLVTANLAHGNNVVVVDSNNAGAVIRDTDALVTSDKGVFLSITVADCLPIFYFDPVQNVVALAHAGWKGALQEIAGETVRVMKERFSSNPSSILVGIGPHICADHYEVQSDVADRFTQYGQGVLIRRDGRTFLDLAAVVKMQLLSRDIKEQHIEVSGDCTFALKNAYYSYRRDKPEQLETMLVVFGMRNGT